jgi:hypothetical protein
MADGRMLKRVISTSPRLAALKNDTHRLIYTWLIPFLDVEGRIEADPRIIKGLVVTLLDHITVKVIKTALKDMADHDLIVLYNVNGNDYLQLQRFEKHQRLRKDKERGSDIPAPPTGGGREEDGSTPAHGREEDGLCATQEKLREEKLKEKQRARENSPVDNSPIPDDDAHQKEAFLKKPKNEKPPPNSPKPQDAFLEKKEINKLPPDPMNEKRLEDFKSRYEKILKNLSHVFPGAHDLRQIILFVESHIKRSNQDAMIHALESLYKAKGNGTMIVNPKGYLEKILAVENGNYNERENIKQAQAYKEPGGLEHMGSIFVKAAKMKPRLVSDNPEKEGGD